MKPLRILQIDDDPLMLDIVESVLSREDRLAVRSCDNGEDGLLVCSSWRPDLVLCDVLMPTIGGLEVLSRLRNDPSTACIPVIFTTGRAEPSELVEWIWHGAASVIQKPFDFKTLVRTICDHLNIADDPNTAFETTHSPSGFLERLREDAQTLERSREELSASPATGLRVHSCVHKLAGTAAIYGFSSVSAAASAVEEAIVADRERDGYISAVTDALDELLDCMHREVSRLRPLVAH